MSASTGTCSSKAGAIRSPPFRTPPRKGEEGLPRPAPLSTAVASRDAVRRSSPLSGGVRVGGVGTAGQGRSSAMPPDGLVPRVRMTGISKRYGAIRTLDDVHLTLMPGEVLGLVGDNGAGKSTLSKVLSGRRHPRCGHDPDRRPRRRASPRPPTRATSGSRWSIRTCRSATRSTSPATSCSAASRCRRFSACPCSTSAGCTQSRGTMLGKLGIVIPEHPPEGREPSGGQRQTSPSAAPPPSTRPS